MLGTGTLLGCGDLVGSPRHPAPAEEVLAPGIHPRVVLTADGGGRATLELHLRRVEVHARIASYQGELRYDAARLELVGASVPQGITGVWHEVEKGAIRFAGIAVDGIGDGAVLTLELATRGEVRPEDFELRMEELVARAGFHDLVPSIRQQGARPAFSRDPGAARAARRDD